MWAAWGPVLAGAAAAAKALGHSLLNARGAERRVYLGLARADPCPSGSTEGESDPPG